MKVQLSSSDVEAIRKALRRGTGPSLRRRRWIAALSGLGLADFTVISLYQMGVLRRLPDLPGRLFDSNAVNASREAYAMGLPDGTTGALLYALDLVLASAGGTRETGRRPIFSVLLFGAVAAGAAAAAKYTYEMLFQQKKICPYCVTGAAINFAMVPLALSELRDDAHGRPASFR